MKTGDRRRLCVEGDWPISVGCIYFQGDEYYDPEYICHCNGTLCNTDIKTDNKTTKKQKGRHQTMTFQVYVMLYWSLGYSLERAPMVLMALRAMTAHILPQICAVVFTSPLTSRLCSQLQELQELPTSPLRMWSSSKKHQLILTLAPGPGVEPGSRGHEADVLPLSYPHIRPSKFMDVIKNTTILNPPSVIVKHWCMYLPGDALKCYNCQSGDPCETSRRSEFRHS